MKAFRIWGKDSEMDYREVEFREDGIYVDGKLYMKRRDTVISYE